MGRDTFLSATAKRATSRREAGRLLAFVVCWTATHARLGRRPTVDEYAEDWNMDARTAYREQADFREVWPEFLTPSDVAITLGVELSGTAPHPAFWPNPIALEG